MILKQTGLLPTSRNDIRAMLSTFELVAGSRLQLGEVVWAEIRQRITFEPNPQILDRVEIRRIQRQKSDLDMTIGTVQVIPYQFRPVRLEAIPDNQEPLLAVGFSLIQEWQPAIAWDGSPVNALVFAGFLGKVTAPLESLLNRDFPLGNNQGE
jgi:hypothetical protein